MSQMNIIVNEEPQCFYLALKEKWVEMYGHEIKIGKYRFCAIPIKDKINVSEVSTGMKLFNLPIDSTIYLLTQDKEDAIKFFYYVGERIQSLINKADFEKMLNEAKTEVFERLGDMPGDTK